MEPVELAFFVVLLVVVVERVLVGLINERLRECLALQQIQRRPVTSREHFDIELDWIFFFLLFLHQAFKLHRILIPDVFAHLDKLATVIWPKLLLQENNHLLLATLVLAVVIKVAIGVDLGIYAQEKVVRLQALADVRVVLQALLYQFVSRVLH